MRFWLFAIMVGGIAYGISEGADARIAARKGTLPSSPVSTMITHGSAEAPIGHVEFCRKHQTDCLRSSTFERGTVMLSDDKFDELQSLNREINRYVRPMSDMAQYKVIERWTYPDSGKGDCEDYVLLKQRRLIKAGWPQSALLITVVRDENQEGHAVLTVHTDRGDYILDNKNSDVLPWTQTQYDYIKRQSSVDPQRWETLVASPQGPAVAAAGIAARK